MNNVKLMEYVINKFAMRMEELDYFSFRDENKEDFDEIVTILEKLNYINTSIHGYEFRKIEENNQIRLFP